MKKFKYWLWLFPALLLVSVGVYSARTDIFAVSGGGSLRNIDVFRIDSTGDVHFTDSGSYDALGIDSSTGELSTYKGDLSLGTSDTRPSVTADTYPGIMVPIYNGSGASWSEGDVIVSSAHINTTAGVGTLTTALATTTVLGVAAETIADGAVGFIRVGGWSIVKTTGAVKIGDVLVTTNTVAGRAGVTTGTQVVGTSIGKAMSVGAAAGDTVLTLLSQ